jgi:hypothetical protein
MRFPINCNDSTSVWAMTANPITGSVRVRWFSNPTVQYKHTASRRAILSLLWHSKGSKGQWVNRHCLQRHQTVAL